MLTLHNIKLWWITLLRTVLKSARKASVFTVASINSEENLVAPAVLRKLPADQRHVILPTHFPDQNIYHQNHNSTYDPQNTNSYHQRAIAAEIMLLCCLSPLIALYCQLTYKSCTSIFKHKMHEMIGCNTHTD